MSIVRKRLKGKQVVAILVADIHLSHRPPLARSAEPNWYLAMRRQLVELKILQEAADCPIVCAGDIFDNWNSPPELINFAIANLPFMYAVPGQHDLPYHSYEDRRKSAYWTLVEACKIKNLYGSIHSVAQVNLHPFPWGTEVTPTIESHGLAFEIAVVHSYIWSDPTTCFPDAPKEAHCNKWKKRLEGYDVAVFGDNHKGFITTVGKTQVWNCGSFFRRHSDEVNYNPRVGLLLSDGTIGPYCMDCSQDKFLELDVIQKSVTVDVNQFLEELSRLVYSGLDFVEAVKQFAETNKTNKDIMDLIHAAIRGVEK